MELKSIFRAVMYELFERTSYSSSRNLYMYEEYLASLDSPTYQNRGPEEGITIFTTTPMTIKVIPPSTTVLNMKTPEKDNYYIKSNSSSATKTKRPKDSNELGVSIQNINNKKRYSYI